MCLHPSHRAAARVVGPMRRRTRGRSQPEPSVDSPAVDVEDTLTVELLGFLLLDPSLWLWLSLCSWLALWIGHRRPDPALR